MIIFCYPNCSTCKRAIAYLDNKGISYTVRNIKTQRANRQELQSFLEMSGKSGKQFFNTSGQTYRALGLKEKIPFLSEDQILDLLSSDGMLVKRPLLVSDRTVLIGFRQPQWDAFFQASGIS